MDKARLTTLYTTLLPFLLVVKQQLIKVSAMHDITVMQALALIHINPGEPQPMHTLSRILGCDASNTTGIIDGLERKGLIVRRENPKDRRVKTIALEPRGVTLRQIIIQDFADSNDHAVFGDLTADELETLGHILHKITAHCPGKIQV